MGVTVTLRPKHPMPGKDFTIRAEGLGSYDQVKAQRERVRQARADAPLPLDRLPITVSYDNRTEAFHGALHPDEGYIDFTTRAHFEPGPFTVTVYRHDGITVLGKAEGRVQGTQPRTAQGGKAKGPRHATTIGRGR